MPGIKDFRGQVVVITGAGSGIGRATALAFAQNGADLVLADVQGERLAEVAGEVSARGGRAITREVDVADKAQVDAFAAFTLSERGHVDILFNNAGVGVAGALVDTDIADYEWIFAVNYWGVLYGLKAFLPHMIARRHGHVVNTASAAGLFALPNMSAYCSTKFAVVGLSETLRSEVRRYGIGVSTICPGVINTRIVAETRMHVRETYRAKREVLIDFYRRFGWPPERVAKAVLSSVRHNRSVVPVGPEVWLQWFTKRLSQKMQDATIDIGGRFLMGS